MIKFWCQKFPNDVVTAQCHRNASWYPNPVQFCSDMPLLLGKYCNHVVLQLMMDITYILLEQKWHQILLVLLQC